MVLVWLAVLKPFALLNLQPQEVHQWLRGVCRAALLPGAATADGLTAEDLRTVRAEVYPPSAANAYAHLRVAEYSDQIAALPPEVHGLEHPHPSQIVTRLLSKPHTQTKSGAFLPHCHCHMAG